MEMNEALSKIYEGLLADHITIKQAVAMLNEMKIKTIVKSFINKDYYNSRVPYFEEDMQNIYLIINILQYVYNNSDDVESPVSDPDYNSLYEIMIDNGGKDIISAPVRSDAEVDYHLYPELRGTLDKVYYLTEPKKRVNKSRKTLDEWIRRTEDKIFKETGKRVNLNDEEVWVFPKWDGVSAVFENDEEGNVQKALQRGNTDKNEGTNITRFYEGYKRTPEFKGKKHGVKYELMMKEKYLKEYNEAYGTKYKNTRSIVSAVMNSNEVNEILQLITPVALRVRTIDGYEEVAREAFKDFPSIRCTLGDRQVIENFAQKNRWVDGFRCDGAVIHIINPELQKILGREDEKNKYEVAYKFTEEIGMTTLIDVNFTTGLFASINPVARVVPIKLKGNTIDEISLGSMGRFHELCLAKGDDVKILYDIIPYLVFDDDCKMSGHKPIPAPENCPECGAKLLIVDTDNGKNYSCNNPDCSCRHKGKILNYLDKLDIDNISYGVVEVLYNTGYLKTIEDLYTLKDHKKELQKLPGYGKKSVKKILDSIEKRMTIYDYELLGSVGIEDIGRKIFKKVLAEITIDELIDIAKDEKHNKLIGLPGIKDKTAKKIIDGLNENSKLIKNLRKILTIEESCGDEEEKEPTFKVCFTKVRNANLELRIKQLGGKVTDNVTKDTDLLVVPKLDIESSKVTKATDYGIKIITIDELPNYLNGLSN